MGSPSTSIGSSERSPKTGQPPRDVCDARGLSPTSTRARPLLPAGVLSCSWISRPHETYSPRPGAVPGSSPQTHPVRSSSRNDRDEAHMSWSLNIGKVAGTVVRLHITFVLFLAWIFVSNYASSGAATAWNSLLFLVLL